MSRTKEQRDAQRTRGPLIASGQCHFCGYNKLPPKSHWCSGDCAQEHAEETRQNEVTKGSNGSV